MMSVCFFISRVTFMCGRAGVCALGAVAAKLTGDSQLQDRYLARFHEVISTLHVVLCANRLYPYFNRNNLN